MTLLQRYAQNNCDEAFAALVARHLNMVHSVAFRKTGNAHAADDITQAVFIILARKSARLSQSTILSGWLYQTARLTAANFIKTEIRRSRREQEAIHMRSLPNDTEPELWSRIAPHLDDALGRLNEKNRNAVVLRFFEEKSFQEIGAAFGVSENAAKKKVGYALERLRRYFSGRGVVSTAALIAVAISANSMQAAPPALAKSVAAVALTKGAVAGSSIFALTKGTLKLMAWTKAKTLVVGAVVVACIAIPATTVIHQRERLRKPQAADFSGTDFPKSSWAFAGYGNPQSASLSFLWSLTAGDLKALQDSLTPEEYQRQLQEMSPAANKAGQSVDAYFNSRKSLPRMDGIQMLGQQVISDNEVILNVMIESSRGMNQQGSMRMKKLGSEWKFDGMVVNTR